MRTDTRSCTFHMYTLFTHMNIHTSYIHTIETNQCGYPVQWVAVITANKPWSDPLPRLSLTMCSELQLCASSHPVRYWTSWVTYESETMPSAISQTWTNRSANVRIHLRLCPGKWSHVLWWICTFELWLPHPERKGGKNMINKKVIITRSAMYVTECRMLWENSLNISALQQWKLWSIFFVLKITI